MVYPAGHRVLILVILAPATHTVKETSCDCMDAFPVAISAGLSKLDVEITADEIVSTPSSAKHGSTSSAEGGNQSCRRCCTTGPCKPACCIAEWQD